MILKKVYEKTTSDYNNWYVWSSIDRINDIYTLVKQSGGNFWGIEEGKIGHKLSSVLIGPDRMVLGSWKDEKWQAGNVKDAIQMIIK